jgi:hypothetical protein
MSLLTLLDIAKREDPDGMPAMIAELLHETNPILDDIPWMEGNLPTGHRSTIRTGLPTVSLRRLNEGVASSKSTTQQIEDGASIVEAWSTTDVRVLKLSKNPARTRLDEAAAFIEAMGQRVARLIFYGDQSADDREFNGFDVRYDDQTGATGQNILSCDGDAASDNSSIWLVGWGDNKVMGMYPRGTAGGLQHTDHGVMPVYDSNNDIDGAKLSAAQDQWTWDCGLVVKDWRYVARVANITMAELDALSGGQLPLADVTNAIYAEHVLMNMARATHRIPNLQACRPVFYMNRGVFEGLDMQQLASTGANQIRTDSVPGGPPSYSFRGIPIRVCDVLDQDEPAVTV